MKFREITKSSCEILFEVWDQGQKIGKSDAFMGLAIGNKNSLAIYLELHNNSEIFQ